jgi:hypothetical protein
MAHTHEFDCRVCGAHLDSKRELDEHTKKEHTSQASSASSASNPSDRGSSLGGSGNVSNR